MFILTKKIHLINQLNFTDERICMRYFSSLIVSVLLLCTTAVAQSPYKTSWEKDGIILGVGAAVAGVGTAIDEHAGLLTASEISSLSRNDINAFDRSASFHWSKKLSAVSDVTVIALAMAPGALFLDGTARKNFQTISAMYFETMLFAAFLPSLAKGSVGRIRPFVYNENAPMQDKLDVEAKKSFFSGHTTVAFASAVFLSTVYDGYFPDSKYGKYVWGGSLLTASLVGYLRYASGAHFPTDILTGAVIGSAVGYLIPYLHRANSGTSDLFPSINKSNGITLHYMVQF